MITLGIETSCDETSVAITDTDKILSNKVSSSVHLFSQYGGVIPEMASRHHLEYINYVLKEALKEAGVSLKDIKLIAVTQGPGLVGALLIGVSLAKSLSYSLNIPLIGVNHLMAHLYANLMQYPELVFPFIGLIISGGHTSIFHVKDIDSYKLLGQTQDDAVGESFDKAAKVLGLGYPGGPIIEKRALSGSKERIKFKKSVLKNAPLDFSFSGIKTAVLYYLRDNPGKVPVDDICASFQETVCDMITEKTIQACLKKKISRIAIGGGVSANKRFREKLNLEAEKLGIKTYFPPMNLCLDNAAMTAGLGEALFRKGHHSELSITAYPTADYL